MRKFVTWFGLALALSFAGTVSAFAAEDFDRGALPHDKASLQSLNELQLGLLRAAVRHCGAFYRSRHSMNFCVTSNVDLDVRQSRNAALKAFHFGLPPSERYNEGRSMVGVQRIFHPTE